MTATKPAPTTDAVFAIEQFDRWRVCCNVCRIVYGCTDEATATEAARSHRHLYDIDADERAAQREAAATLPPADPGVPS